jgi:hypothetical protein
MLAAEALEPGAEDSVGDGEPHDPGCLFDLAHDPFELALGADQIIIVFKRLDILELRAGRPLKRVQRFPRAV